MFSLQMTEFVVYFYFIFIIYYNKHVLFYAEGNNFWMGQKCKNHSTIRIMLQAILWMLTLICLSNIAVVWWSP